MSTDASLLDAPLAAGDSANLEYDRGAAVPPQRSLLPATLTIGMALLCSGAAGLVNQVVWQRSLKVFLGGSETACSTVVVLVFMAGLGVGSIWMGRRAASLRNPLRAFGVVEAVLGLVNLGVCALLASQLTSSVFVLQSVALTLGVPLLLLYAALACVVLCLPCLLMGATMPLAAEACQRNLGAKNARLIGLLFFVNTLGSVIGTVVSSGYMISHWGLTLSLLAAAAMNLLAGLLLLVWTNSGQGPSPAPYPAAASRLATTGRTAVWRPGWAGVLACGLGFCSLGYEMYLFRLIPLRHEPLPFTFAAVLAGFLTFWSAGAALSSWRRGPSIGWAFRLTALCAVATMPMFVLDTKTGISGAWSLALFVVWKTPYFIPCLGFGYLFGRVATESAESWGNDIGRIYAWNTLGSCAGILAMTFIGYELPFFGMIAVIALLLYALQEYATGAAMRPTRPAPKRRWMAPLLAAAATVFACLTIDVSRAMPNQRMFSGRDGVIVLMDNGDMIWDGLWHSSISIDNDHVGTNNWSLAVCPVLSHGSGQIEDVCVIGTGTGITAGTLAKLSTVQRIDAYDICHELKNLYRDYPAGTLHVATNPKIRLLWQDARTGLALNPRKYDLIQTQPLYLIQAGSSLLNSVEFYELIRDRLKPGGIFSLYSNGTPEQAYAVRETADRVFAHRESFMNGYLLILSNDPIQVDEATLTKRLARWDPLWDEIRSFSLTSSADHVRELLDSPRLKRGDGRLVVRDDRPILEYPGYLRAQILSSPLEVELPRPRSHREFD